MQEFIHEFSELQRPIGYHLDRHDRGQNFKKLQFDLTLASKADGITVVPILLNYCEAHEFAQTLLAAAQYLREQSHKSSTEIGETTDET